MGGYYFIVFSESLYQILCLFNKNASIAQKVTHKPIITQL